MPSRDLRAWTRSGALRVPRGLADSLADARTVLVMDAGSDHRQIGLVKDFGRRTALRIGAQLRLPDDREAELLVNLGVAGTSCLEVAGQPLAISDRHHGAHELAADALSLRQAIH